MVTKLKYRTTTDQFQSKMKRDIKTIKKLRQDLRIFFFTYIIWELKGLKPNLKWSIVGEAKGYSNVTKPYILCLYEKLTILTYPIQQDLLNKRSELVSKCRHQNKFLLANYKSKDWSSQYLNLCQFL